MKRFLVITTVIGIVLGVSHVLFAEEQKAPPLPSGTHVPSQRPSPPPMSPAGVMGLMGAMPKPAAASPSQEQPLHPMFYMLGPNMTGTGSLTLETRGTLLMMQGEMMMKMGEVMMKYGQMMSGKTD